VGNSDRNSASGSKNKLNLHRKIIVSLLGGQVGFYMNLFTSSCKAAAEIQAPN